MMIDHSCLGIIIPFMMIGHDAIHDDYSLLGVMTPLMMIDHFWGPMKLLVTDVLNSTVHSTFVFALIRKRAARHTFPFPV